MNITNTIWRNSHSHPGRVAVLYEGHPLTYRELRVRVELASARLAIAGVTRGDVVGLSVNNRLAYLIVLLAVARMGAVATPLSPEHRNEFVDRNRVNTLVREKDDGWRHDGIPSSRYLNLSMLLAPTADGESVQVPPVAQGLDDEPWLIPITSGTTGVPKSNPHTHSRAILTLMLSISTRHDREEEGRALVFIPLGVHYAMGTVVQALFTGWTVVLTQFLTPEVFYGSVERDRPTVVATTTGMASSLVAHAERSLPGSAEICSSIRSMVVAGSALSSALRKEIADRISPHLETYYGSTEAGILATETPETQALQPTSAGRLNAWVYGEAVDDNDQPLPQGKTGLLRFKSPLLADIYLGDDEATNKTFRNGWFYPGDAGAIGPAGFLFLAGRTDHVVNLGGNKIDAGLIERLLEEDPAIIECAVVASAKEETGASVLVAVVEARAPFDAAELKRRCLERLGKKYVPQVIIQIDALPRNDGGKVMRRELAARLKISSEKQPDEQ